MNSTNGRERGRLLYCHLGHQLTCGADLLCGGSGHGGLNDRIDAHELFARMIRRGQIDLNRVMELALNPQEQGRVRDICPPQHLRLRIFDFNPGDFPNDSQVCAAGIAHDGTIWVVSGIVPEGENGNSIGLRLRIEGIPGEKRTHQQFPGLTGETNEAHALTECNGLFGPSLEIGAVCVTPHYFSYLTCDINREHHFFVVRERKPGLPVTDVIPFSSDAEIGLRNETPYCFLQGFLPMTKGPWSKSVKMMRDDLCEATGQEDDEAEWVPSTLEQVRDEADVLVNRSMPAHPRSSSGLRDWNLSWAADAAGVSLVTNHSNYSAGPVYDHIHTVRVFGKSPGSRKIIYVAQKGNRIYKVTVNL